MRSKRKNAKTQATAYHEAGHAVAQCLLGIPTKRISIVKDELSWGRTSTTEKNADKFRPDLDSNLKTKKEVISLWSGLCAEKIFTGKKNWNWRGAGYDLSVLKELIPYLVGSSAEIKEYAEKSQDQTSSWLKEDFVWNAISKVTTVLLKKKVLTPESVIEKIIKKELKISKTLENKRLTRQVWDFWRYQKMNLKKISKQISQNKEHLYF